MSPHELAVHDATDRLRIVDAAIADTRRGGAELQQASLHAQAMYQAIAAAQSAIAAVHNVDPVSAS